MNSSTRFIRTFFILMFGRVLSILKVASPFFYSISMSSGHDKRHLQLQRARDNLSTEVRGVAKDW